MSQRDGRIGRGADPPPHKPHGNSPVKALNLPYNARKWGSDSSLPPKRQKRDLSACNAHSAATAPHGPHKECPLATPSACRARIAFDRAGLGLALRSRHSALWAVAVASVNSQANRPPLLAVLCPCGAGAKALFKNTPPRWTTKRGSRCRRQWGTTSPKGVDPASRRRGQGERAAPRRGCPWAVRRSRSKRPLLVDEAEAISIHVSVTVTVLRRPHRTREGRFFN